MQIHELNNFLGQLGLGTFVAVDNGQNTGKVSITTLLSNAQEAIDAVDARIDNIITSPAPSEQEIIDARLGASGKTYASLGDAIRAQGEDLNNEMSYLLQVVNAAADLESGTYEQNVKTADNRRIRVNRRIKVEAGDVVSILPNGLYVDLDVYASEAQGSTIERLQWAGGSADPITYKIKNDGYLVVLIANGATWNTSTPITVSDYDAQIVIRLKYLTELFDDIEQINKDITAMNEIDSEFSNILDVTEVDPVNWIDDSSLITGRILWNGTIDSNAGYKTTDYIPVENGDVLRFYNTYLNPDAQRYELSPVSGERLALYDADKNYLGVSGQYPISTTNGYTVSNANAKYIRLSFTSSYTKTELTRNTAQSVYTEYFTPYKESLRIAKIEKGLEAAPDKIIDCWGDSLTEMNIGTSYSDYLAGLLGSPYIVTNKGLSGQSIGQVGFRFGSNEVFLTLDGNKIPASGPVNVTGVICSIGSRQGYNMETADDTRGSRCSINGVPGMFVYHRSGAKTFTRDTDGAAVNVFPGTKAIPDPYFDRNHMQILWGGKNDFSYSAPFVVSGIEENFDAMVNKIPHNRYIILGQTYSNGSDYAPGSSNRAAVDTINAYLSAKYPNNFIDIQTELVANGLTLESITPTQQDEADIADGFIPSSLMFDATHPNQYGREAIAKIIYQFMQNNAWL